MCERVTHIYLLLKKIRETDNTTQNVVWLHKQIVTTALK